MKYRMYQIRHRPFFVCWVGKNLFSYEDFLGLYEMDKTDAKILWLRFDSKTLRGHCYDGCAVMMGKRKEVATQIKNDT